MKIMKCITYNETFIYTHSSIVACKIPQVFQALESDTQACVGISKRDYVSWEAELRTKGSSDVCVTTQFFFYALEIICFVFNGKNGSIYNNVHANSPQSHPTFYDHMGCSTPGSSVHGILQARKLEWVAMASSR